MATTTDVTLSCKCTLCGHEQTATAVHPVFEGDELVEYTAGSSASYCDKCDGPVEALSFHRTGTATTATKKTDDSKKTPQPNLDGYLSAKGTLLALLAKIDRGIASPYGGSDELENLDVGGLGEALKSAADSVRYWAPKAESETFKRQQAESIGEPQCEGCGDVETHPDGLCKKFNRCKKCCFCFED